MAGKDPPPTWSNSQLTNGITQRAATNDLAKRALEVWFTKFIQDIPKLDAELPNYAAWIYAIKDVFKKRNCLTTLSAVFNILVKLSINNSQSVNLLMTHSKS